MSLDQKSKSADIHSASIGRADTASTHSWNIATRRSFSAVGEVGSPHQSATSALANMTEGGSQPSATTILRNELPMMYEIEASTTST